MSQEQIETRLRRAERRVAALAVALAVAVAAFRIRGLAYWPAIVTASLLTILIGGVLIYRSKGAMRQFITVMQGGFSDA